MHGDAMCAICVHDRTKHAFLEQKMVMKVMRAKTQSQKVQLKK